jgi:predicted small lipoprotein YifL
LAQATGKGAEIGLSHEFPGKILFGSGLARPEQSLYGAAAFGDIAVNRTTSSASSRRAALILIAVTLALTGCGRKGGLDLPPKDPAQPTAAAEPAATAQSTAAADSEAAAAASRGNLFDPSFGSNQAPVASKGTKKPFVLDPLLNN